MPNNASAIKRVRQNDKKRMGNRVRKSRVKTQIKNLERAISQGNKDEAIKLQPMVQKTIDQAVAAGIYKKNMGSRMKSKIMRAVNHI